MTEIVRGLWQGSHRAVVKHATRFDVVVLCAVEHQVRLPPDPLRTEVLYVPLDDTLEGVPAYLEERVVKTARRVAHLVRTGHKVLVTCNRGWNRSGLIVALAMHYLGMTMMDAIWIIWKKRKHALCNLSFVEWLRMVEEGA